MFASIQGLWLTSIYASKLASPNPAFLWINSMGSLKCRNYQCGYLDFELKISSHWNNWNHWNSTWEYHPLTQHENVVGTWSLDPHLDLSETGFYMESRPLFSWLNCIGGSIQCQINPQPFQDGTTSPSIKFYDIFQY